MGNKTKKIFILSLLISIVTLCVLSFFLYKIYNEGVRLEEQVSILTENNKKETAYLNLKRLAQETQAERDLLASSFFKEEGDSIVFLGEVEELASELGLSLEIESLEKVSDKETNQEYITVTFAYSGQKEVVLNFSKLMEVVPYHSKVQSLSLSKLATNEWGGELTILITINSI